MVKIAYPGKYLERVFSASNVMSLQTTALTTSLGHIEEGSAKKSDQIAEAPVLSSL